MRLKKLKDIIFIRKPKKISRQKDEVAGLQSR